MDSNQQHFTTSPWQQRWRKSSMPPPAWWGYTNKKDRDKIDHLFRRMIRCGFLPAIAEGAAQLSMKSDSTLFQAIIREPYHVLQNYSPYPAIVDITSEQGRITLPYLK